MIGERKLFCLFFKQRANILADLEDYVGEHGRTSLIPPSMSYRQYLSHRQHHMASIGIRRSHGLRHQFAQQRYLSLSNGLLPRRLGGPLVREMTEQEKTSDTFARLRVSSELGHSRIGITRTYLG